MAQGWHKFTGNSPYPVIRTNEDHTSFAYGVPKERKYRLPWLQGKRNAELERSVLEWIESVTRERVPNELLLAEWLKDGRVLCRVLDELVPGCLVRRVNTKSSQFASSENITNFLQSARQLGFADSQLFELSDLFDNNDVGKVLRTLGEIRDNIASKVTVRVMK
ncbi:muscular protein 20 [Aphelenchoides avenae]|nr:muscular protein 20 [Aphelenchus avenae]